MEHEGPEASEKDRTKLGRKKRLLHELRLAREMAELVSSVTVSENLRKWERRRRNNRCDVLELLVVVPKITERAWWDMVAGEPMCEQTGAIDRRSSSLCLTRRPG